MEDDGTTRQLDEVAVFLELNSDYCEILVEGRVDAAVFEEFLRSEGCEVAVYPVDDRVNVSADRVENVGENIGVRGRVVACAKFFSETTVSAQVTCIVDADFHYLEGDAVGDLDCLLRTDYGSLELYGMADGPIRRLFKVGLRASSEFIPRVAINAITEPLIQMFACRWAFCAEEYSPSLLSAVKKKRARVTSNCVTLDLEKLIVESIQASSDCRARKVSPEIILRKVRTALEKVTPDLRRFINGHDFVEVLSFYISSSWPSLLKEDRAGMKKSETLAIALLLTLKSEELKPEPMFSTLLQRVKSLAA